MKNLTTSQFIEKAKLVHGDKYDYSESIYESAIKPLTIICNVHGKFYQKPNSHISDRNGCSKCKFDKIGNIKRNSIATILNRFKDVHDETYDYSSVVYKNLQDKVLIICKVHGSFMQSPTKHASGQGCPSCKYSSGERKIMKILDELNVNYKPQKTFDNLYGHDRKLKYDFYLLDDNILIEYDGEFHFDHTKIFNFKHIDEEEAIDIFLKTKEYDSIKTMYAINNNIPLLRISYKLTSYIKIKKLIEEFLAHHKWFNLIKNKPKVSAV